jgi:hypothetical protein
MFAGPQDGREKPLAVAASGPGDDAVPHDMALEDQAGLAGTAAAAPSGVSPAIEQIAIAQAHHMLGFVRVSRDLFPAMRDLADHPGWEIMLHLFLAPREGRLITADDLCAITGCWRPLANRYIDLMFERGIVEREGTQDKQDRWPLRLTVDAERRFLQLLCGFAGGWDAAETESLD